MIFTVGKEDDNIKDIIDTTLKAREKGSDER